MRRVRLIPSVVLALLIFTPERARSQWQLTGDVGVARLRQEGIPQSNAATLGAGLEVIGNRAWFRSSVLGSRAAANRWTAQGVAVGSLVGPVSGFANWELSGVVSGFDQSYANGASSAELMARLHFARSNFGSAIGVGGGRVNLQGRIDGLAHGQFDLWRIVGDHRFVGTLSYVDGPSPPLDFSAARNEYADISGGWRYENGGLSIGATGGGRTGQHSYWASGDATLWFAPKAALVVAAGRSLQDATRGVPQTRYASISIRISARPHVTLWSRPKQPSGPVVVATRERLEVRVAKATSVEVMGDFTEWSPVALNQEGKAWCLTRAIAPGLHRIALRIDGGEWTTPANLPRETDDLGGVVGIITIP